MAGVIVVESRMRPTCTSRDSAPLSASRVGHTLAATLAVGSTVPGRESEFLETKDLCGGCDCEPFCKGFSGAG